MGSTTTYEMYIRSNNIYLDKAVSGEYVLGKPPKKPGGIIRKLYIDKTRSGEYVLDRPPKKPGGISSTVFVVLVMNLCLHFEGVNASNLGLNHRSTSERDYVSYLLIGGVFMTSVFAVLLAFVFCLISWFKYVEGEEQCVKAVNTRECLATGTWGNNLKYVRKKKKEVRIDAKIIHDEANTKEGCFDDSNSEYESSVESFEKNLKDQFELEAICLIAQVGIDCNTFHEQILSALWNAFKYDISLLIEEKESFAWYLKGDPEERIRWFFSKVECEIDEGLHLGECEWEEAGMRLFKKLCKRNQTQSDTMSVQESIQKILPELKLRRRFLGSDKWRALRQKHTIPVETQKEVEGDKKSEWGTRTSNKGIFLFGAAQNSFPSSIPELNISKTKQNVSEAEERIELIDMNGGIISNLERKSKLNDDDCTETTAAESLDLSLDAFSINESVNCRKEWSIVVNNTRYICSERPEGKSSFVVTDEIRDDCEVQYETTKERNTRLLLQHQKSYVHPAKGKRYKHPTNSLRREKRMQVIKEEDARDENYLSKLEVSPITRANKSEKEELNSDDTLRRIRKIIRRKARRLKKKTRQSQRKIKNITPPVNRIKFIYLREAMRIFTKVIRLYSSSAFRYAMFRSNRRYKPGD